MDVSELRYEGAPERLDRALAAAADLSRGAARRLIGAGAVYLNGCCCQVASRLVRRGDRLAVGGAAAAAAPPPAVPILFEGDGMIVIDKPVGMPTAPTRQGAAGTALTELTAQLQRRDGRRTRLWVVHRLDAATSGVLAFATTPATAATLSEAFRLRAVRKQYLAVVTGVPVATAGVVDQALRTVAGRARLDGAGRPARTVWRVRERRGAETLLEVEPESGRLHQIRAHLAAIGHPIVGDRLYGGAPAPRLMLQAVALTVLGRTVALKTSTL